MNINEDIRKKMNYIGKIKGSTNKISFFSAAKFFILPNLVSDRLMLRYTNYYFIYINEPVHEISNNVVCATSKASDQQSTLVKTSNCWISHAMAHLVV